MRKNHITLFIAGVLCVVINLLLHVLTQHFNLPIYLDSTGTILISALSGYLPGIFVALASCLIKGALFESSLIYFGITDIVVAVCSAHYFGRHDRNKNKYLRLFLLFATIIITGIMFDLCFIHFFPSAVKWSRINLLAFNFYTKHHINKTASKVLVISLINTIDKLIILPVCFAIIKVLPLKLRNSLVLNGWRQTPISDDEAIDSVSCRSISLKTSIIFMLSFACISISLIAALISLLLFKNYSLDKHKQIAKSSAALAATFVNGDNVERYLNEGEVLDYNETKEKLNDIRDSSPIIEFVYVYKVMDDGCHVIFDLDTEELAGGKLGEVVPFDESFLPYVDTLMSGNDIDAIITDDTFGWLLTEYEPVYDSKGNIVCFAAVDIQMKDLRNYEYEFLVKLISLFLGFFILVMAIGMWLARYRLIYPVNTMAASASDFAYNTEEARENNVSRLKNLNIHTGDEIENLYKAMVKTTQDSMDYFSALQSKTQKISELQSGLIMVLADIVENRDESTGDHIKKTAAYVNIIMQKMREDCCHLDILTDEYISDTVLSAPLHDIGKIKIPDAILNKPGKLTDEEFEIMKTHTTAGEKIIDQTIATMPDADYLLQAKQLAGLHHERWDGRGYPYGLKGEEIPLCARIMAVADVFDALVSKRCYKDAFPLDKAFSIIEEESGTHFDPDVVNAFLSSRPQVEKVAKEFEHC